MALDPDLVDHRLIESVCHYPVPFVALFYVQEHSRDTVSANRYQSMVRGYCYEPLARRSRSEFAGERTSRLQQAQLAGARYRFGAPSNLEFAKDVPIVPFDSNQGEEKPLADLTIRESLGDESQYF
jgi:hypothetical protein